MGQRNNILRLHLDPPGSFTYSPPFSHPQGPESHEDSLLTCMYLSLPDRDSQTR